MSSLSSDSMRDFFVGGLLLMLESVRGVFLLLVGGLFFCFFGGGVSIGEDSGVGSGSAGGVRFSSCVWCIVPCVLSSGVRVIPRLRLGFVGHVFVMILLM